MNISPRHWYLYHSVSVASKASDLYKMPFISYLSDLIHITVQISCVWGGGGGGSCFAIFGTITAPRLICRFT